MIINRFFTLPVLLLCLGLNVQAQGNDTDDSNVTGEGWIYEIETDSPEGDQSSTRSVAEPAAASSAVNHSGGGGIDMIIGGQGKDGIAKRGTLKVID